MTEHPVAGPRSSFGPSDSVAHPAAEQEQISSGASASDNRSRRGNQQESEEDKPSEKSGAPTSPLIQEVEDGGCQMTEIDGGTILCESLPGRRSQPEAKVSEPSMNPMCPTDVLAFFDTLSAPNRKKEISESESSDASTTDASSDEKDGDEELYFACAADRELCAREPVELDTIRSRCTELRELLPAQETHVVHKSQW